MQANGEIREAIFLRRVKRFSALVEMEGKEEIAYLPNTGRIWELFIPGQQVFVVRRHGLQRKTIWDLYLFPSAKSLVWADPRAANPLVFEALKEGFFSQFQEFRSVYREVTFKGSRFDFLLASEDQKYLLEAKSVTLVQDGRALFPDAPTRRGTRQLESLMEARKEGYGTGIVFVIQREDACVFSPNEEIDPQFSDALYRAAETGIGIYAYGCRIKTDEISLGEEVGVSLGCAAQIGN